MFGMAILKVFKKENTLVEHLRKLMFENKINEAELARQTNIPQPTLHKVLTGKTADPRISTLQILANYFQLSVDVLLSGDTNFSGHSTPHIESQSIPILTWSNCLDVKNMIQTISPSNWDSWLVIEYLTDYAFGLKTKPSMEPRFPKGSILIIDPDLTPQDGDLVIVHFPQTSEATMREIIIDGPIQQLMPLNEGETCELVPDIDIIGVLTYSRFAHHVVD